MKNLQVNVYRHVRSGGKDEYEATPAISNLEVFFEPAGTVLVAPIDSAIGQAFNFWVDSYTELDLKEGYKLVNVDDANDYYLIRGGVQSYRRGDLYHYEFVCEKPVNA